MIPKLHILTLTWNGLEKLNNLKPMLEANLDDIHNFNEIDSYWYVRDNGSKDNTLKEIDNWDRVKIFDIGHNKHNFSQGVNYLFDQANPDDDDLILLLNNDIKFNDNVSLNKMIKLMTPDVGIVGAKLLYTNTDKIQHGGIIYSNKYGGNAWNYRRGEVNDFNASKNRYFQGVTGAVLLTKASIFKKVNGLAEDLNWSFDDCDYGLKVLQLGKKIIYCGEVNCFHDESFSLKKNPVNSLFMNQNLKIFRNRWFGKYKIDHDLYLNDQNHQIII